MNSFVIGSIVTGRLNVTVFVTVTFSLTSDPALAASASFKSVALSEYLYVIVRVTSSLRASLNLSIKSLVHFGPSGLLGSIGFPGWIGLLGSTGVFGSSFGTSSVGVIVTGLAFLYTTTSSKSLSVAATSLAGTSGVVGVTPATAAV